LANQAGCVGIVRVKPPVFGNFDGCTGQYGKWIGDFQIFFCEVAACTGVKQIVVFAGEIGTMSNRQEMIDLEEATYAAPLLAKQAVDATKAKLIAKPASIARLMRVAGRSVPPPDRVATVNEWDRHVGDL
jgi:hypothetical protein